MPELTLTSPYFYSRVYSKTFTMGNPMPESTLSPQSGTMNLASLFGAEVKLNRYPTLEAAIWGLEPSRNRVWNRVISKKLRVNK
jgi:hypothetical protein